MLVAAAPAASTQLLDGSVLAAVVVAFVSFCAASSGVYCINDALDADADRAHPTKRHRPVAAELIRPGAAIAFGVVLIGAGIGLTFATGSLGLTGVVAGYVAFQVVYTTWLKRVPVVELAGVASGFVLRAVAGGLATGTPISEWFLIVTSFGALLVVVGKRHAELMELGEHAAGHRDSLSAYSPELLRAALTLSATVAVVAYCLWAFGAAPFLGGEEARRAIGTLSVVPFTLAILRYLQIVFGGGGGAPEDIFLRDRTIMGLGGVWALTTAVGIA